jgi:hypothetical protein
VRIPLDYYRILGLPILATADQIQQAFRDRTLQLPRPEFSTQAIASRKTLLQQACDLLANDANRSDYDARFLSTPYGSSTRAELGPKDELGRPTAAPQSSDIEVEESQFVGGLILLQELGEYESVLRLGRPYLNPTNTAIQEGRLGEPQAALSDIVLTIALACLELGREEWQQGHYDNAAQALETGQELLIREGLFPAVRAEIQADLYKLRPYRILAMLSDPDEDAPVRERGIVMLRDMLNERHGIDGNGIDQSGLGVDDFLRFIQQLRDYMTVDEQQALFEVESRRPSAVATYLSVYALMAKGFARQEPALIRRAKAMLARLGMRQDVYLEQAICSLLLGQPDVAAKALERSQEYEPLVFIREHSEHASDLLPGLCLYTERWMQEEVFPHFRDLRQQTASLKDYFANPQVQAYLEELPLEAETALPQRLVEQVHPGVFTPLGSTAPGPVPQPPAQTSGKPLHEAQPGVAHSVQAVGAEPTESSEYRVGDGLSGAGSSANGSVAESWSAATAADRPLVDHASMPLSQRPGKPERRRSMQPLEDSMDLAADLEVAVGANVRRGRSRSRRTTTAADQAGWLIPLLGLLLLGLLGYGLVQLLKPRPAAVGGNPETTAASLPSIASTPTPSPTPQTGVRGEMNQTTAKRILQFWFDAKKAAFGPAHDTAKLSEILTEPRLSQWRNEAIGAKAENLTIAYTHKLEVKGVDVSPSNPNQATITAYVREGRAYTKNGAPLDENTDELVLNYRVLREDDQWKIKDW